MIGTVRLLRIGGELVHLKGVSGAIKVSGEHDQPQSSRGVSECVLLKGGDKRWVNKSNTTKKPTW